MAHLSMPRELSRSVVFRLKKSTSQIAAPNLVGVIVGRTCRVRTRFHISKSPPASPPTFPVICKSSPCYPDLCWYTLDTLSTHMEMDLTERQ